MITREFKLYLNAGVGVAPVINTNQFDQDEEWIFTLLQEDGTVYTPSTSAIIGLKTDGTTILNAGTVNSSGQVVITETEQITAVPGSNLFEILIDGNTHGTANFVVFVERRPGDIDNPSESDISLFQEAISAAGNVTQFQADIAELKSDVDDLEEADTSFASQISQEASTRSQQDAVLQAEIDQIIAPSGEAPSAAEVQNARIGADGKTYDTLGNAIRTQVSDLKNALSEVTTAVAEIDSLTFTTGYYIATDVAVGEAVDITQVKNNGFQYVIAPCEKGDVFTVTATGGVVPKVWTFTDSNYIKISGATTNKVEAVELIASADGFIIVNANTTYDASVAKKHLINISNELNDLDSRVASLESIEENVTHVTNPHLLFWRMGAFDQNGAQGFSSEGMLTTDRFFTVVKLKAGSTISKKTPITRGTNISYGYKLSESDNTLSGFLSNAGNYLTVEQDCIAYVGIRYSNPVADLLDDSVLDLLDFDLNVIDYESKYNRKDGTVDVYVPKTGYAYPLNYGYPCPDIYYKGQHTDTTGWTNSFSDINAIHSAFDALASDSDGYFSRTRDYGVVYTGNAGNTEYSESSEWHMYEYATKPVLPSVDSVPKVAITCCIHGNEKMSAYAMHYLMYDLIYNSTRNPVLSWIKSNCIITFIPICNPYGFMKPIPSRLNENGVNLGRNFPTYNWAEWEDTRTDGNGSEPGGMNYKGESAGSETETKAMMKFYRNNYDAVFAIDLHTNGADTVSRDMISAFMPALPQNANDANYEILYSLVKQGKLFNSRLKPWLNGEYGAELSYSQLYGTYNPIPYYPCAPHWGRETAGLTSICYEVMAGSTTGFLGNELTAYAPATIKAAAEEIANMIVTILAHLKY